MVKKIVAGYQRTFDWNTSTTPLHWVYFLYFTVHAHEDRHGTGILYQREWGKDYGFIEKNPQFGYSLNKNIGEVLEKHFSKPPEKVRERMYVETAVHWNTRVALSAIGLNNDADVYGVSDVCANKLAKKFNWNQDILIGIFLAFVKTVEQDKIVLVGEQEVLHNIAKIWRIENSESLYSDGIKFIDPPKVKGCNRYEGGVPICPKCSGFMEQLSRYNRFEFNKEYYEQLQNPIDEELWSCGDCAFTVK